MSNFKILHSHHAEELAMALVLPLKFIPNYIVLLCVVLGLPGQLAMGDDKANTKLSNAIQFNRDIRPILSDKCYACHGPDSGQRQADLRLDLEEEAKRDLGGYAAIVANNSDASEVIQRILSSDVDEAMPPADHPKQLNAEEKRLLVEWIKAGAQWQDHWAYIAPQRYEVQAGGADIEGRAWGNNFIDGFILSRLNDNGVKPSAEADAVTLLRRLSFDLTGLPPSPDEVKAFSENASEAAYEANVERLLRSPHFGERMAMYWLDLVRYADTVGYHGDQDVSVSPFRDYVIEAFNSNMPFDQFTREQLAGDLLDSPSDSQLIASGYNKLGMMSAEGGVQPEEYLVKYAADRVRTASTVWMGSTLGCAECHDHKFDPFTAKDFYRFASFFADIKERGLYSGANRDDNWGPVIKVPDVGLAETLQAIDAEIKELELKLASDSPELLKAQQEWETQQLDTIKTWQVLVPKEAKANKGKLEIGKDGSVLASGASPDQNKYELEVAIDKDGAKVLRLDALPDPTLPKNGPGRAGNGNFVVSEVRLFKLDGKKETSVEFASASASWEQSIAGEKTPYKKWAAEAVIDKDAKGSSWGWAVLPKIGEASSLVLRLSEPLTAGSYKVVIEQNHTNPKHTLGKFQLAISRDESAQAGDVAIQLSEAVRSAFLTSAKERTSKQQQEIRKQFRNVTPLLADVRNQLQDARKRKETETTKGTRTSLITVAVEPREMRVLARGNWMDKSGEVVSPGVPHFLDQISADARATRLDLAQWLTGDNNPLTARVFVNRLWKLLFGAGLSKVLDDVGSQGEIPSHPELLDTLAVEFVESGWDVKHMIKLIVMSSAYRQSSLERPELAELDPYNRLLARQSRFRLDAEVVRDNALAISDLLVRTLGGKSVKPYQPEGLLRHLNFPKRVYKHDEGENQYRRGVYTHWQRQFLHPAMQAFDAPAREECTAERPRSNTPLAALVLLNDPSYVEAARRFAENVLERGGASREQKMNWMMQKALSRNANSAEMSVLSDLLEKEIKIFKADVAKASELVEVGLSAPNAKLDPSELAAWTTVTRAVLNMHETVTRN